MSTLSPIKLNYNDNKIPLIDLKQKNYNDNTINNILLRELESLYKVTKNIVQNFDKRNNENVTFLKSKMS
jgi:hypothetical protein